jgi:hypothetical protein
MSVVDSWLYQIFCEIRLYKAPFSLTKKQQTIFYVPHQYTARISSRTTRNLSFTIINQSSTIQLVIRSPNSWSDHQQSQIQSHIATDGQSESISWCRAPFWDFWPENTYLVIYLFWKVTVLTFWGAPSLTRGRVCHVSVLSLKSTVVVIFFFQR